MSDESWFTVTAVFEIRADSEDAATDAISDAVTAAAIPGLFPVGTFSVKPSESPIERARRARAEH